jgi:dihydroorotase
MKVLLQQVQVIDTHTPFHHSVVDILITDGIISKIGASLSEPADRYLPLHGSCVSIGWADCFAHFCDPGYEYKETLATGAAAAAAGGFTDVAIIPNTLPALHTKSQIEYVNQRAAVLPVRLHPIAAITQQTEGKALAEMYDMQQAGAIAFSDGIHAIQQADILLKALQYVKAFDGLVIQLPHNKSIGAHGLVNEGIVSTQLGLPGIPAIAEELLIARDIELLRYTGGRLHLTGVTTARGIALISAAKKEGLDLTCSVTPAHLLYCDEDLTTYDTNLKLRPPLRTAADRDALRTALADGTIDCLASHHLPQDTDSKICEFEYAQYGMSAIETMFSAAMAAGITPDRFVDMQTIALRKLLRLPMPTIAEGATACLTMFDPKATTTYTAAGLRSRSKNTTLLNRPLPGQVKGIIQQNQILLNGE